MIYPSFQEFLSLSRHFDIVPVHVKMLADAETPITIFRKLVGNRTGCLLESAENGQFLGRYSFIACDPVMSFVSTNGIGVLSYAGGEMVRADGHPLEVLRQVLARFRFHAVEGLARFYGGAVGYLAFEAGFPVPRVPHRAPGKETVDLPDCQMFFPETVIIYDHLTHQLTLVVNCYLQKEDPGRSYQKAVAKSEQVMARLAAPMDPAGKFVLDEELQANMTDAEFMEKVDRIVAAVRRGDADQVVLSRRYEARFSGDDFEIYRRLRSINPSPYMFYLSQNGIKAIGSSPEMLLRVEQGQVTTCPIAGTRPRGTDAAEDLRLVQELLADPKEIAEHRMLIDYALGDLRKVCEPDSLTIAKYLEPQYFSHVIHLVSQLAGRLRPGVAPIEALAACFPAGTVLGTPRDAAAKIIEDLEPSDRGIYGGAVGYVGFNQVLDTGIAIRTAVIKDNRVYVQVGAGIVADSRPELEFMEVKAKAEALCQALGLSLVAL
ncbi:MAG TPA: anthranilate synthase component I family protein [Clostridia bacterium]|nr:anthranilate synthase component I family protein [Clostridia bacterium]